MRIAELLGVAGTDVPIAEIEKLIPPYKVSIYIFCMFLIIMFFKYVAKITPHLTSLMEMFLCFFMSNSIVSSMYLNPDYKRLLLQLGVNGYSFAVNNNGYILYHPDLRPMVRLQHCSWFVNACAFDWRFQGLKG